MSTDPGPKDLAPGGERLQAFADRALHWPARHRLLVADLHLGKGDVFRRAGIAVPRGGTAQDLARLDALLVATGARELWVLGDLVHGPVPDAPWRMQWGAWRERHARLRVAVVAGNHDRALGPGTAAAARLGVELLPAVLRDGPFELRHAPPHADADRGDDGRGNGIVLCGHLHPVFALPGMARRWPGFWQRPGMLVLPAFSAFTGGWRVDLAPGERALLCVEGSVIPLSR
jgi:DNA ligase-associated metallophosphoesterase